MEHDSRLKTHLQKQSRKLKQKNDTGREKLNKDGISESDSNLESEFNFDQKLEAHEREVKQFGGQNKIFQNENQKIKTGEKGKRESVKTLLKKQKRQAQSNADKDHSKSRLQKEDSSESFEDEFETVEEGNFSAKDQERLKEILEELEELGERIDHQQSVSEYKFIKLENDERRAEFFKETEDLISEYESKIEQVEQDLEGLKYDKFFKTALKNIFQNLEAKIEELSERKSQVEQGKTWSKDSNPAKENHSSTTVTTYTFSRITIPPLEKLLETARAEYCIKYQERIARLEKLKSRFHTENDFLRIPRNKKVLEGYEMEVPSYTVKLRDVVMSREKVQNYINYDIEGLVKFQNDPTADFFEVLPVIPNKYERELHKLGMSLHYSERNRIKVYFTQD